MAAVGTNFMVVCCKRLKYISTMSSELNSRIMQTVPCLYFTTSRQQAIHDTCYSLNISHTFTTFLERYIQQIYFQKISTLCDPSCELTF